MLKILHTSNWHIGRSFGLFEDTDALRLTRERINVVDRILGLADSYDVDAVMCTGNLFNEPQPESQWWRALRDRLTEASKQKRPIILVPGNHDPLLPDSVYSPSHEFRKNLPDSVHVVDDEKFIIEIKDDAILYAVPCTSHSGDRNLALSLPDRELNDDRIRIGMAHGSLNDEIGSSSFPISKETPAKRGLDYLAIGNMHHWQEFRGDYHAPIISPGTPEPTGFSKNDAGYVALVNFRRSGIPPKIRQQKVNRWTWQDRIVNSMEDLHQLAHEDLKSTVLRLRLQMTVDLEGLEDVEKIVDSLQGNESVNAQTAAFICDRSELRVNVSGWSIGDVSLPESITAVIERLKTEAEYDSKAQRALLILKRMLNEALRKGVIF